MSIELHVQKGGMMSASMSRISTVCFPVFDEGVLIGNLTGDDLQHVLNEAGFVVLDSKDLVRTLENDELKTARILRQNGLKDTYQDLEGAYPPL